MKDNKAKIKMTKMLNMKMSFYCLVKMIKINKFCFRQQGFIMHLIITKITHHQSQEFPALKVHLTQMEWEWAKEKLTWCKWSVLQQVKLMRMNINTFRANFMRYKKTIMRKIIKLYCFNKKFHHLSNNCVKYKGNWNKSKA